jgi:two-component system NtrC family sensor kinase
MEVSTHEDDEHSRIANLESYLVMDSEPEVCFDQLAFLASTICETPIALISFIDFDRQWFKSSVGIELHEIPRYLSACNQTIKNSHSYVIPDVKKDNSQYKEFMAKEGFQFYAGVPITSPEGFNLGTLCVIDYEPKTLTNDQLQTLHVIADQICDLLEVRKKYRDNLQRLKDLGEASYRSEKRYHEIAHKAGTRAMAELSAGLAYRIKPHIMAIQSVEKRLEKNLILEAETSNELKIITDSSHEVLHILDSLEKFILAEKEQAMKVMDLSEALHSVINHLEYKIKKYDITFHFHLEHELRCIGNLSQIKEALFAVINNAIEAVINMKTRVVEVTVKESHHKTTIFVKDSGRGISENIVPFIFQPFFTTKGPQGLGIGLSLAQSLLQRHLGEIKLIKAFNPTTFCLMIPTP